MEDQRHSYTLAEIKNGTGFRPGMRFVEAPPQAAPGTSIGARYIVCRCGEFTSGKPADLAYQVFERQIDGTYASADVPGNSPGRLADVRARADDCTSARALLIRHHRGDGPAPTGVRSESGRILNGDGCVDCRAARSALGLHQLRCAEEYAVEGRTMTCMNLAPCEEHP